MAPAAELRLQAGQRRALLRCKQNDTQTSVDLSKGCKGEDPTAADPTEISRLICSSRLKPSPTPASFSPRLIFFFKSYMAVVPIAAAIDNQQKMKEDR